ncbi:class I SAM-dependent methyltransferase, partial [Longicatena caecimuris]|uniref:class I SAM-dependent methyltransferase n=1 Tax=Longicatena caecimuris TaxID=1796635 RepID=UPI001D0882E9
VELGTGYGNSTSAFVSAAYITGGKVISIDHKLIPEVLERYKEDIEKGYLRVVEADTVEYADHWSGTVDV